MAAYAATVTSTLQKPIKVGPHMLVYHGQINITNYNTTVAEITGITGKFRSDPVVLVDGVSESGFGCHWDPTDKGVKCFNFPTSVGAATEVASDTDIGLVYFTAFGFV